MSKPVTPDEWLDVRVLDRIGKLHAQSPETAEQVMALLTERVKHRGDTDQRWLEHRNRLELAWFRFRVFMAILGFCALVVYAAIAVLLIQAGGLVQASIVLGGGSASVVAIFVTGRAASPLFSRRNGDSAA